MHRLLMCVFFFKQKTAYEMRISDWSSDVCSSDLFRVAGVAGREVELAIVNCGASAYPDGWPGYKARYSEDRDNWLLADTGRSAERRVGKEGVSQCRYRVSLYH